MQIWAHRGASAYAPENTLEAFKLAVIMGADGVELDVQLTKDNKLVVIHDEYIDRVSDGSGFVRDFTLLELRKYNFNKTYFKCPYASIPTLEEVLYLIKGTGLCINIELKTGIWFYKGIEERTVKEVNNMKMGDNVWYSSFNHSSALEIKRYAPQAKIGLLYMDGIIEPYKYGKLLGAEALHPAFYNLKYPDYMMKCKEMGLKVHAWTVDNLEDVLWCRQNEVDAVITNDPETIKNVRE